MFSSNIGFRRRTVSEGYNQLLPPASSSKRGSSSSQRHSLDESSSTTVKRIILRKHSNEPTGSRGLADRIALSEVENINGFWSRRLSGQRRSLPSSPKQVEPNVAEWRRETRNRDGASVNTAERSQISPRPRGPRPLSKVQVTSPVRDSSHQIPSGNGYASTEHFSGKISQQSSLVAVDSALRTETSVWTQLLDPASQSLTKNDNITFATDRARVPVIPYRPLLLPGLPVSTRAPDKTSAKQAEKKEATKEKEEKKRFAQLELTLSKLIGAKRITSNQRRPARDFDEKQGSAFVSPLLPIILPAPISISSIPIPPIPDSAESSVSRTRSIKSVKSAKSARSSKSGKSTHRKSSRKRKTGLARIVVELAKGEKVVAVDAEAIQEAAEVGDILAQLRKMKAA